MAEKIVSPGVFTNEKDLSFLPAGVAQIGAAIVGPTPKGPAFVPTLIRNFEEFKAYFGDTSDNYYVPYAVKAYLKSAAVVTVMRVCAEGGYYTTGIKLTNTTPFAVLLPANGAGASNGVTLAASTYNAGALVIDTGTATETYSVNFNPTSASYIGKVLGTSPVTSKLAYCFMLFKNAAAASSATATKADQIANFSGSVFGKFQPAETPWITSQLLGSTSTNLFKVKSLGDGDAFNRSFKISVINNTLAGNVPGTAYGSFTLLVREFTDNDQRPVVLETYSNLNLDPDSPNYIARRIGDRYYEIQDSGEVTSYGDYANVSKYIRVEVTNDVKNKTASPSLNPYGFAAYLEPINVGADLPVVLNVTGSPQINGEYSTKAYYGVDFTETDNFNYFRPVAYGTTAGNNDPFNLDTCLIHPSFSKSDTNTVLDVDLSVSASLLRGADVQSIAKFTLGLQKGFDGTDPAVPLNTGANILNTNTVGLDCSGPSTSGSLAYRKALNVLSNAESYDVNLIAMPGITIADHVNVVNRAVDVATDRGDAFLILDPVKQGETVGAAVSAVASSNLDTSYAATYWPWVKIMDINRNKPVWVPPSVVIPRVMAQSDTAAYEWFAPAGLNRGGVLDAVDVEAKLSFSQRDTLYENRINPLATFPAQGVCVWGQKTLQTKASALDRINVRRLMITLKKYIASSTRYLVFENNTIETRQRFLSIVTPYLETVQARQGLYAYRVVMDETNNTPDVIDRNELYGQIFLQPAKTAEFIVLDFNILPTGATFDNA